MILGVWGMGYEGVESSRGLIFMGKILEAGISSILLNAEMLDQGSSITNLHDLHGMPKGM